MHSLCIQIHMQDILPEVRACYIALLKLNAFLKKVPFKYAWVLIFSAEYFSYGALVHASGVHLSNELIKLGHPI